MMGRRFVVLDRDGTVIVKRHYLSDPDQVELLSGAATGLRRLRELDLGLVLVTNQSAIGRGFFDQSRLELVHRRLRELLEAERVRLDGIYFCPHKPDDECVCRKPQPGMVETAAEELDFDPRLCFVIGDNDCDVALGRRVGATTILVRTGYGAQVVAEGKAHPDYVVDNLAEAAQLIERLISVDERV
ncbi:MAG TPA: HAD family hydrolase [Chthoniobacterales bacterium]|nr:HAD family hydrolase [Chthoniobacterales bacterium]